MPKRKSTKEKSTAGTVRKTPGKGRSYKGKPKKEPKVLKPLPFDEQLAASYVGKYILLGIRYLDQEGNELRLQQLHGVITSATQKGIQVQLRGIYEGQLWVMPPDLRAIQPAKPGTYTLHVTGELIENPDLVSAWTMVETPPDEEKQLKPQREPKPS